jgi:hypothetical protein
MDNQELPLLRAQSASAKNDRSLKLIIGGEPRDGEVDCGGLQAVDDGRAAQADFRSAGNAREKERE